MVTGSTSKACNQGQKKNSEKSSSKARDEMPSVGTSSNETTSDVSCDMYMAVQGYTDKWSSLGWMGFYE